MIANFSNLMPCERRRTTSRSRSATTSPSWSCFPDGTPPGTARLASAPERRRSLDHLLTDATLGAVSEATIDRVLDDDESDDVADRVDALARAIARQQDEEFERLARTLIRLTVESPPAGQISPRRGYHRVEWIEQALAPLRGHADEERLQRLVSALAMVMGWGAMLVLRDIRGLDRDEEEQVSRWAAWALVKATLDEDAHREDPREKHL